MYNVNNNGPRMDPWGTPYDMSILSDVTFSRYTDWTGDFNGCILKTYLPTYKQYQIKLYTCPYIVSFSDKFTMRF